MSTGEHLMVRSFNGFHDYHHQSRKLSSPFFDIPKMLGRNPEAGGIENAVLQLAGEINDIMKTTYYNDIIKTIYADLPNLWLHLWLTCMDQPGHAKSLLGFPLDMKLPSGLESSFVAALGSNIQSVIGENEFQLAEQKSTPLLEAQVKRYSERLLALELCCTIELDTKHKVNFRQLRLSVGFYVEPTKHAGMYMAERDMDSETKEALSSVESTMISVPPYTASHSSLRTAISTGDSTGGRTDILTMNTA